MSDALSSQAEGLIEVCEKMIAAGGGSKFVDATTGAVAEKILEEAKKQLPGDSVLGAVTFSHAIRWSSLLTAMTTVQRSLSRQ